MVVYKHNWHVVHEWVATRVLKVVRFYWPRCNICVIFFNIHSMWIFFSSTQPPCWQISDMCSKILYLSFVDCTDQTLWLLTFQPALRSFLKVRTWSTTSCRQHRLWKNNYYFPYNGVEVAPDTSDSILFLLQFGLKMVGLEITQFHRKEEGNNSLILWIYIILIWLKLCWLQSCRL